MLWSLLVPGVSVQVVASDAPRQRLRKAGSARRRVGVITVLAVLLIGTIGGDAAPAPSLPLNFGGRIIPGLCELNQQAIFNSAKVGTAANAEFKKMRDTAQGGVNSEEAKIKVDLDVLRKSKRGAAQVDALQREIAKRQNDLRAKATRESQELDAILRSAAAQIAAVSQPLIKQIYIQRKCGMLIPASTVLAANSAMDITSAVIQSLDAKVSTISLAKLQITAAKK